MTEPRYTGNSTDFYRATPAVAKIVNLAIDLKRPILVEGEPGCGKTTLASSIAKEKNLGDVIKISVKSTSRAQDLLYRVNALKRLQEVAMSGGNVFGELMSTVRVATLGQISHALYAVGGEYRRNL